jgi:hypothetical protein
LKALDEKSENLFATAETETNGQFFNDVSIAVANLGLFVAVEKRQIC